MKISATTVTPTAFFRVCLLPLFLLVLFLFSSCGKRRESLDRDQDRVMMPRLNMEAFSYDRQRGLYYQEGVSYIIGREEGQRTLSLYIPEAYVEAFPNGEDSYTCRIAGEELLEKRGELAYPDAELPVVVMDAERPLPSLSSEGERAALLVRVNCRAGEDSALLDMKSAIRYIRLNEDLLPGDMEEIYLDGRGLSPALSLRLGVSGDSELFRESLSLEGAVSYTSDSLRGVFLPDADIAELSSFSLPAEEKRSRQALYWGLSAKDQEEREDWLFLLSADRLEVHPFFGEEGGDRGLFSFVRRCMVLDRQG